MNAFLQAFLLVALAEMGDKTQLVALAFATRFKPAVVIAGVFGATAVVHIFSVAIGEILGLALPTFWLSLAAGIAFIGFGAWTLRGDKVDDEETLSSRRKMGAFFTVALTFFVAELGDKTMLATITLASQLHAFVPVWLGSTLGMVLADGLAIVIGLVAGKKLPERPIRYGAAVVFFGAGVFTIASLFL